MKQLIKVPPSKTEQTIEVTLPDTVAFKITGTTQIDIPSDPGGGTTTPPSGPILTTIPGYQLTANVTFEDDNPMTAEIKALMATHNQHGQGSLMSLNGKKGFYAKARYDSARGWARSEIQTGTGEVNKFNPREGIWRAKIRFISGTGSAEGVCLQHHGTVDGTSGDGAGWLSFVSKGVNYRNMRNVTGASLGGSNLITFNLNTDYYIEDKIKFSTGNDGYWITTIYDANGNQLVSRVNAEKTRTSQSGEQFFKAGLYWWTKGNEGDAFISELQVYTKQ